jgi:hypothetical protein
VGSLGIYISTIFLVEFGGNPDEPHGEDFFYCSVNLCMNLWGRNY